MFGNDIAFDSPWWLLLLVIAPLLWIVSYRTLSGLGRWRRRFVLGLRAGVLTLLVLALAEMQFRQTSDRVTVIYLLDQSASIPAQQREAMVAFVRQAVSEHRNDRRQDRAGVIVFGRGAMIEAPPFDDILPLVDNRLDTLRHLRTDATDLEAALKLAQAVFQEDSSRRIVIVSDGAENLGDARAVAPLLAQNQIGIDVVPIAVQQRGEVAVEKILLPVDIRRGQPFEGRVVVTNLTPPTTDNPEGMARGMLKIARRMGGATETFAEYPVELPQGKSVFRFQHEINQPDFYEYQAIFVPETPADDRVTQNNRATSFTHVRGSGHVLLIEDWEHPGNFEYLASRLRLADLKVTIMGSDQLFSNLAELQRYDSVILANVPRSSGFDAATVTNFSDEQVRMLVRNTQQMGSGLVMLGGDNSLGAGGWANTPLEEAMPVDFSIDNAKIVPVGALVMTMHASEMAQGNYWQRIIAEEALQSLGPQDYCGVIGGNGVEQWLWSDTSSGNGVLRVGPNRRRMLSLINRMTPGDMQDFEPGLQLALIGFTNVPDAATKHMIIISDGDPNAPRGATIQQFINLKVKISTVAIGAHGAIDQARLQSIATQTGGTFYKVTNPQALPRIFQREARRISRPLIKEFSEGVEPQVVSRTELLQGIEGPFPPITGFVLSTVKDNPLVEVSLASPKPVGVANTTLLASWTYGLGRTAVVSTDAGHRWSTAWTQWSGYDPFFTQIIRWSMRPVTESGNFSVAVEEEDGQIKVIVTALDQEDEFLNFLDMSASIVSPDMESEGVRLDQIAPGRYVGQFDADAVGSYLVTVSPGAGRAPIRTGISIPYSAEFRQQQSNEALLVELAGTIPVGAEAGRVIRGSMTPTEFTQLLAVDPFRDDLPPAVSSTDAWPLLALFAACLFFADVFVRRVHVGFAWLPALFIAMHDKIRGTDQEDQPDERIERLRAQKRKITDQVDRQRLATRFEPKTDDTDAPLVSSHPSDIASSSSRPTSHRDSSPSDPEEETYMERLLKAKQKTRRDEERKKP